jgi:uncharacterized membrane protein
MKILLKTTFILLAAFALFNSCVFAQEKISERQPDYYIVQDGKEIPQFLEKKEEGLVKSRVLEITEEGEREIPGTNTKTFYQLFKAEILEGSKKGTVVEVENDYIPLKQGEKFYLNYIINGENEIYTVHEPDRSFALYFFATLFILVVLVFGKIQGLRSLLSLASSFFIIIYLFLPKILDGASPILTSIIFSVFILIFAIYFTHGFNRKSTAAVLGSIVSIIFTGFLAKYAIYLTRLSGFAEDESIYLNFATQGQLDFGGLLLGAIIIGVLGILDDIAITQASCVAEFKKTSPGLSKKETYKKAMNVGRDHVGALLNTLALAYTGAALPLLLLLYSSDLSVSIILNKEIFATEIIRTIVGSIGLILTVPVTTLVAVFMFSKKLEKK